MYRSVMASRRLSALTALRAATQQLAQASKVPAPGLSTKPPADPGRRETWWLKQLESIAVFLAGLAEEQAAAERKRQQRKRRKK